MTHNEIAALFRDELTGGWDDRIYNFAAQHENVSDIAVIETGIRQLIASASNKNDTIRVREPVTKLVFEGVQIKSLETFKRFAAAIAEIEEQCGVYEVEITMKDIFFCPWIDTEKCRDTHMERLLIGLIDRLENV